MVETWALHTLFMQIAHEKWEAEPSCGMSSLTFLDFECLLHIVIQMQKQYISHPLNLTLNLFFIWFAAQSNTLWSLLLNCSVTFGQNIPQNGWQVNMASAVSHWLQHDNCVEDILPITECYSLTSAWSRHMPLRDFKPLHGRHLHRAL